MSAVRTGHHANGAQWFSAMESGLPRTRADSGASLPIARPPGMQLGRLVASAQCFRSLPQMIVLADLNKLTSRSQPPGWPRCELACRRGPPRLPSSSCTSFLRRP